MVVMISRINQPYNVKRNKIIRNVEVDQLPNPLSSFNGLEESFELDNGACNYGYVGTNGHIYYGHTACHSDLTYFDPNNFGYVYNFIYNRADNAKVHTRFVDWLFSDASPWRNCLKTVVRGEVSGNLMYAFNDIDLSTVEVMSFLKAPRIYTEHGTTIGMFLNKLLDDPLIHPGIAYVFAQLFPPTEDPGCHREYANWHGAVFDNVFSVNTLNNFMNGTPNLEFLGTTFVDSRCYEGVNAIWNPHLRGIPYEKYLTDTYSDIVDPKQTVTTRFGCKVPKGGLLKTDTLIAVARKESERWL